MNLPPLRYADNDGIAIAYRTAGEGQNVVYTSGATVSMDGAWNWMAPVAEFARTTVYDKRGIGLSDGVANFSFEERMDDIRAVMDDAGIERAHLVGTSEGGPLSVLFAATYPDRVLSLTLYGTYPSYMRRRDYPAGQGHERERVQPLGRSSRQRALGCSNGHGVVLGHVGPWARRDAGVPGPRRQDQANMQPTRAALDLGGDVRSRRRYIRCRRSRRVRASSGNRARSATRKCG